MENCNYAEIEKLMDKIHSLHFDPQLWENYQEYMALAYTHHSTAIEGNTLSFLETKIVVEDKLSVDGKELRELYEVRNHHNAFSFIQAQIADKRALDENLVKDIHEILVKDIFAGGIYRNGPVRITGSLFRPPDAEDAFYQMKSFYDSLKYKNFSDPVELAAWTHAEFVRIHPFPDGNGRTARLLMNYQLMSKGLLFVDIEPKNRLKYYQCLEEYAVLENLKPFYDFIANLELSKLKQIIYNIPLKNQ